MLSRKLFAPRGSTLVEIIISLSIISVVILAVISVLVFNLRIISSGKARAIGTALANEKMENLRNMPYDNLATVHGPIYPAGTISDDENITVSGIKMRVHTDIDYVDDAYDGNFNGTVAGKPKDLYPYDYKKATISVYLVAGDQKLVSLSSNIAGKVAETSSNTGIIAIKVQDASGNPVADAAVHLTNSSASPVVDITTNTDNQGQVLVPKMPPDANNHYHIEVTKAGYSSDQTYPVTAQLPVPAQPDFSVLTQQTISLTFTIDQTASLIVRVKDPAGATLAGKSITVTGQKLLNDPNSTPNVPKTSQTLTTDASGQISIASLEWDSYTFSISGYKILASSPYSPVSLNPLASITVDLTADVNSTGYPIISNVSPRSAPPGASIQLDIIGSNLNGNTTIRLKKSGQSDIVATGVSFDGSAGTLSGNIDLSGATTGNWDIVVTKAGLSTTQVGGLNVSN